MAFPADFFQVLTVAGTISTQSLKLPNNMLESVYMDYDSGLTTYGNTVNIIVPTVNASNATDIGNGSITGIAPTESVVPVVINKKYSSNRKIPDFDQLRSNPVKLAELYMAPVIEEVLRVLDAGLCGLVTAANFPATPVTGVTQDTFIRADVSKAWATLRAAGVPITPEDVTLLVDSGVYGNMMAHQDYANWSVQGGAENDSVNRRAILLNQYNVTIKDDPLLPNVSGIFTGILMHRYAIALRTGLMAPPEGGAVAQTVVFPRERLPVHVQLWYDPMSQSNYIHAFIPCGYAVARPTHGVLLLSA